MKNMIGIENDNKTSRNGEHTIDVAADLEVGSTEYDLLEI